jgi:hypothetical protein
VTAVLKGSHCLSLSNATRSDAQQAGTLFEYTLGEQIFNAQKIRLHRSGSKIKTAFVSVMIAFLECPFVEKLISR